MTILLKIRLLDFLIQNPRRCSFPDTGWLASLALCTRQGMTLYEETSSLCLANVQRMTGRTPASTAEVSEQNRSKDQDGT